MENHKERHWMEDVCWDWENFQMENNRKINCYLMPRYKLYNNKSEEMTQEPHKWSMLWLKFEPRIHTQVSWLHVYTQVEGGSKKEIHQSWASALPVHLHWGASQSLVFCNRNYFSVTLALSVLQVLLFFSLSSYFYFKSKYIFSIILFFQSKVTHISDNRKMSP